MKLNKDQKHTHEDIHDHNKEINQETRSYWRKAYDSTRRAMSRGAQNILKMITSAHGDNWRRQEKKK